MTRDRYFQWMRVWELFRTTGGTLAVENLHSLVDVLWQEERKKTAPEELAAHAGTWALEEMDFANDPDYQASKREMDRAFWQGTELGNLWYVSGTAQRARLPPNERPGRSEVFWYLNCSHVFCLPRYLSGVLIRFVPHFCARHAIQFARP